jgi:hypothetical protein
LTLEPLVHRWLTAPDPLLVLPLERLPHPGMTRTVITGYCTSFTASTVPKDPYKSRPRPRGAAPTTNSANWNDPPTTDACATHETSSARPVAPSSFPLPRGRGIAVGRSSSSTTKPGFQNPRDIRRRAMSREFAPGFGGYQSSPSPRIQASWGTGGQTARPLSGASGHGGR